MKAYVYFRNLKFYVAFVTLTICILLIIKQKVTPCIELNIWYIYFLGLFSGWSLAFLASFAILLHFNGVNSSGPTMQEYAKVAYPLYRYALDSLM